MLKIALTTGILIGQNFMKIISYTVFDGLLKDFFPSSLATIIWEIEFFPQKKKSKILKK